MTGDDGRVSSGSFYYAQVQHGAYLPIKPRHRKVPQAVWRRKQTIVGGWRRTCLLVVLHTNYTQLLHELRATMGDFIFPLKPSFKLSFIPNFGLKPN